MTPLYPFSPMIVFRRGMLRRQNSAPTGAITISGVAQEDQTLMAVSTIADADGVGVISYQWYADGAPSGTGASRLLGQSDVGKSFYVVASYTDGFGTTESVTSAGVGPVANVNDPPAGSVTISGAPTEGQTLTASNTLADADGMGVVSYQWKANGSPISMATGSTFVLTAAQVGTTITVTASYTDGFGTTESVTSAGVGPVTGSAPPNIGEYWSAQGGWYAGSVTYSDGRQFHMVIADRSQETRVAFATSTTPSITTYLQTDTATPINGWDGKANTELLAAANAIYTQPIAVAGLSFNGFDDWYIPAVEELRIIGNRLGVTAANAAGIAVFGVGGAQEFLGANDSANYWRSSTPSTTSNTRCVYMRSVTNPVGITALVIISGVAWMRPIRRVAA